MKNLISKIFCLSILLTLAVFSCANAEVTYENIRTYLDDNRCIEYPILHADGEDQATVALINQQIFQNAEIPAYMNLLGTLDENSVGLTISYEINLGSDYVSLVFSTSGKMLKGRPSQKYCAMTFNLHTGEKVSFADLVVDIDEAESFLNDYAENEASQIVFGYTDASEITPVPTESFYIGRDALTFYYDNDQLSFLSGDSGALSIRYHEMEKYLNLSEESVLIDLNEDYFNNFSSDDLEIFLTAGTLPGLQGLCAIGNSAAETADYLKQPIDAYEYPDGKLIEVENPYLRGTYIIVDESEDVVIGFVCNRMNLYSIITGKSERQDWLSLLGSPVMSETVDENQAQQYWICEGTCDYYAFGSDRTLILCSDQNEVLRQIILR